MTASGDDTNVGGIYATLTLDRDPWNREIREAKRQADELGRSSPDIRITSNAAETAAKLAAVRAAEDRVADGAARGREESRGLMTALLAVAPAVVPIAGAAGLAGAALGAMGLSGVLAVKGITAQMQAGTAEGRLFSASVGTARGDLGQLEATAANGVLRPFQSVVRELHADMPALNREVAQSSALLGDVAKHLAGGVIGGMQNFSAPLLEAEHAVDQLAARFESWASGPGGSKFAAALGTDFQRVTPVLVDVTGAVAHLVAASNGVGLGIVSGLGAAARVIDSFPTPVLTTLVTAFTAVKAAGALTGMASAASAQFAKVKGSLGEVRGAISAAAASASAGQLEISAAVAAEAAAVAAAKAREATAYADGEAALAASAGGQTSLFASEAEAASAASSEITESYAGMNSLFASHAEVVSAMSTEAAAAYQAEADAAAASATRISDAAALARSRATEMSAGASLKFSSLLGPLAAVGLGVGLIASMFHRSSDESKEATAAARAYAEALSADGSNHNTLVSTIVKQLSDNGVPEKIASLNKALGSTKYTGQEFATAIEQGGKPLDDLRDRLQQIITTGTKTTEHIGQYGPVWTTSISTAAKAASKLLGDLNAQYSSLSKNQKAEIADFKTFGTIVTPIQSVAKATGLANETITQYAAMAGIAATKNNDFAGSAASVIDRVQAVAHAYDTASQSGTKLLAADQAFAKSSGGSADRAAIIGATLKANAGDALDFASSMNAASTAVEQLGKDVTGKLLHQVVDLKSGTIDYRNAAAGPLISDLQNIQTGAINAAGAIYQHNRALGVDGKEAADRAVAGYTGVETSLEGQLRSMGATRSEAKRLTEQYLGVPKDVKTLIEQEGADPVVTVLNKIGALLARLTGQPWTSTINADGSPATTEAARVQAEIDAIRQNRVPGIDANTQAAKNKIAELEDMLARLANQSVHIGSGSAGRGSQGAQARATGGGAPEGWFSVGEQGPELAHKSGNDVRIYSNSDSRRIIKATGMVVQGFASGTDVYRVGKGYGFQGQYFSGKGAKGQAEDARSQFLGGQRSQSIYEQRTGPTSDQWAGLNSAAAALHAAAAAGGASAKDVADAASNLNSAAATAGLSARQLAAVSRDQAALNSDARKREGIAARLGTAPSAPTAYERLAAAQQKEASDAQMFGSGIQGSFDITQSGSPVTTTRRVAGATVTSTQPGTISIASILRDKGQAVAAAQKFAAILTKLAKEGLDREDLEQLAQKGPAAMDYAVALSKATPAQIRKLAKDQTAINKAGTSLGSTLAKDFDGAGVAAAAGLVKALAREEAQLTKAMERLGQRIIDTLRGKLRSHSPSMAMHDIGVDAAQGLALGLMDGLPVVAKAAAHHAAAVMPRTPVVTRPELISPRADLFGRNRGGLHFTPGSAPTVVNNIYPRANQSEREIGHAAADEIVWATAR